MKLIDILGEWKGPVPGSVCRSGKKLGASDESSCKAQGHRARETDKKFKGKSMRGKKIRSVHYGGPLKDYS